jgi:4'-phosphopantetheinyl transferase
VAGPVVDLWRAALDEPGEEQVLSPDERARASRYRFEQDRRRFMAGRAALRGILARYLDASPRHVAIGYGATGKPYALDDPSLRFNLAHSGDVALVGVARGIDVGVDVEALRPAPGWQRIAGKMFSAQEKRLLEAAPPETRLEVFFRCWTRKEALSKAIGGGLSLPWPELDTASEGPISLALPDRAASAWSMRSLALEAQLIAGVAYRLSPQQGGSPDLPVDHRQPCMVTS